MKSFYAHSVAWALGLAWLASPAQAQYPNQYQNSYLPIPSATQQYPVVPVANREMWNGQQVPPAPQVENSPSDAPSILPAPPMANPDRSVLSDDYQKAVKSSGWGGDDVNYDNGSCGPDCCTPCQNYWFGSASALFMTRAQQNHFLITGDAAGTRLLCSCAGDMDWTGGVDVSFGHTFNCGCNALQFTYWGLYPGHTVMDAYQSTLGSPLVSGINFDGATYNGNAVTDITDNGFRQQAIFRQSLHNFEINLLGQSWGSGFIGGGMASCQRCGDHCGSGYCGPRWGAGWMMGLRYFQFDNSFNFNADGADEVFNDDVNELCYHVYLENRLWGFQVGGGFNWNVLDCFQLYALAKAGIYNNSIDQQMLLHGAGGIGTFGDGSDININNSANRLAMIGQLDLGARWQVTQCFSVNAGYRIAGISGVALLEHQLPHDFTDSYYATKIESDGMLLLHGAYVGAEFRF